MTNDQILTIFSKIVMFFWGEVLFFRKIVMFGVGILRFSSKIVRFVSSPTAPAPPGLAPPGLVFLFLAGRHEEVFAAGPGGVDDPAHFEEVALELAFREGIAEAAPVPASGPVLFDGLYVGEVLDAVEGGEGEAGVPGVGGHIGGADGALGDGVFEPLDGLLGDEVGGAGLFVLGVEVVELEFGVEDDGVGEGEGEGGGGELEGEEEVGGRGLTR
jgi:hypothetical protein